MPIRKTFVCDIETEQIHNPQKIWVIVLRELDDPNNIHIFRCVHEDPQPFLTFLREHVDHLIGHNFIAFDHHVLCDLIHHYTFDYRSIVDTLILSRLVNYNIPGQHSLEAWGLRLGFPKDTFDNFSCWSQELEDRCIVDTDITLKTYKFLKESLPPSFDNAIELEHHIAYICRFQLQDNGFYFNYKNCLRLYNKVQISLTFLLKNFTKEFPPQSVLLREITPTATAKGTINKKDFRWKEDNDYTMYTLGNSFSTFIFIDFNPRSHKHVIDRLSKHGWNPTSKTKGHIKFLRSRVKDTKKLAHFEQYGWSINEENINTLPDDAPKSAQNLAKYLLLDSRRATLENWMTNYNEFTHRIHGTFNHIGSWTHRLSHNNPNQANVPRSDAKLGKGMRSMWCVPKSSLLVGTDADQIQLRIFAHYLYDKTMIEALVSGTKTDETDLHSINARLLGFAPKETYWVPYEHKHVTGRNISKRYIYAYLFNSGISMQRNITGYNTKQAKDVLENFVANYPGLTFLKNTKIPIDVARGYFIGLDGRYVQCDSAHHMMSGYLQNGEVIVMKLAMVLWMKKLKEHNIRYKIVNFVHDEWQTEVLTTNERVAQYVGKLQCDAITEAGKLLGVVCPLAGESTIGNTWRQTH